jgi:tyrosyl-tRNA synthetase
MKLKQTDFETFSNAGEDIAVICVQAGFAKTKSEARRAILGRAIKLQDVVVEDQFARLLFVKKTKLFVLMEHAE